MANTQTPVYYGYDGATRRTTLSRATLHRAVKSGSLKAIRVGQRVLFSDELLDEWLNGRNGPTAAP